MDDSLRLAASNFGLRWQAQRDTALAEWPKVSPKSKRRRRCALPAHSIKLACRPCCGLLGKE